MREGGLDVLGLLIKHELALKELYEIFATMLKNHEGFWQNLAADEKRHAEWIVELQSNPITGKWYDSQFTPQAIETSIGYVKKQTAKAKAINFSSLEALSIARDLESALLERHFYNLTKSAPRETWSVLVKLTDETERHLKIVVQELASEKQKSS